MLISIRGTGVVEYSVRGFDLLWKGQEMTSPQCFLGDNVFLNLKPGGQGLPWWSCGKDSEFPKQGAQILSLVRERDLACHSQEFTLCMSNSLQPRGLCSPWDSLGQNTGVGSCCLLQEIFPTQELNPGLLHCRQILDQLSHQGSLCSQAATEDPVYCTKTRHSQIK